MKALNQTRDNFSFARFRAYTLRYLDEHKKTLGLGMGVVAGILVFFAVSISKSEALVLGIPDEYVNRSMFLTLIEGAIFFFCYSLFCAIIGSMAFGSMKTKKRRIASMMVPATKFEKYISMIFIYVILSNLCFFGVAILADLLRASISDTMTAWQAIEYYNKHVGEGMESFTFWPVIWLMVLSTLFSQSVYVLGSSLWPRNSFIITFCVVFVLQMVIVSCFGISDYINALDELPSYGLLMTAGIAATLAVYALAWWRFSKTQLVQRFMMS